MLTAFDERIDDGDRHFAVLAVELLEIAKALEESDVADRRCGDSCWFFFAGDAVAVFREFFDAGTVSDEYSRRETTSMFEAR